MKKTAIVMLSVTVVVVGILLSAIFSLGSSEEPLELAPLSLESFSEPSMEQKESEITLLPDSAKFDSFSFASAGATRTFTGKVTSTQTGNGISGEIVIVCDGAAIATGNTETDGTFKIKANRDDCLSGRKAYAAIEYEGTTYTSNEVSMPDRPTFGGSYKPTNTKRSAELQVAEVPEFSVITMFAAVAVSLLGMVYLRKQ